MTDLKTVIAKNICELRTEAKMTQLALAELLNYSDKAISKWERGESVPDVFMLKRIADYFGVSVDYLLTEDHTAEREVKRAEQKRRTSNRAVISLLAVSLVWLVAAVGFVLFLTVIPDTAFAPWLMFIYAVPASSTVMLVFNTVWGKRKKMNYLIISVLIWSLILTAHLTILVFTSISVWQLYLIGAPGQIIVLLWSFLKGKRGK